MVSTVSTDHTRVNVYVHSVYKLCTVSPDYTYMRIHVYAYMRAYIHIGHCQPRARRKALTFVSLLYIPYTCFFDVG